MEILWTKHSLDKMKFYGLSKQRVKRVLRNPKRIEEGIAPGTIALMQPAGSKKRPSEIWLMYVLTPSSSKIIISCWRYPGVSPVNKEIPLPEGMQLEIEKELKKLKVDKNR